MGYFCAERSVSALYFLEVAKIAAKEMTINEKIRAAEVRVIDPEGNQLGVMKTDRALELAYEKGLDLVEMNAGGPTPVCKIMDYGKYRFEQQKREKEARKNQKIVEIKEIRLSLNIGQQDFDTKVRHAVKFLQDGNKVKASIRFRGRERAHANMGNVTMDRFAQALAEYGTVEKAPKLEGRSMQMFIAPKTAK